LNEYFNEKLVAESRNGNKDAYAQLVERFYRQIFLVSLGIIGNVEDAEDAAQEVILKGFLEISKLRNSSQFGPWITRITRNFCINIVRRRQRSREIMKEKVRLPDNMPEQNDNLQLAIEKLPMEIRLPLVMYYFDGQSVRKVAENLDVSTSAVYAKLREAIKVLHRMLAEQGETNGQSL
jgi:RNA polymerase sigma factor (sigma-70 family)